MSKSGSSLMRTLALPAAACRHPVAGVGPQSLQVQSDLQVPPIPQAAVLVPSHSSPTSTTSFPQLGAGQVHPGWQRPGQKGLSAPSQSSPISFTPLPQLGTGAFVQVGGS